jgi:hypothetical protein
MQASAKAVESHIPLLVFFILSPQDYFFHDTSSRRVDFTLRNLSILKVSFNYSSPGVEHLVTYHIYVLGFPCEDEYTTTCIHPRAPPNAALACYFTVAIRERHSDVCKYRV